MRNPAFELIRTSVTPFVPRHPSLHLTDCGGALDCESHNFVDRQLVSAGFARTILAVVWLTAFSPFNSASIGNIGLVTLSVLSAFSMEDSTEYRESGLQWVPGVYADLQNIAAVESMRYSVGMGLFTVQMSIDCPGCNRCAMACIET